MTSAACVVAALGVITLMTPAMMSVSAQEHAHHSMPQAAAAPDAATAFVVSAREGTARYQSLDSAIIDGYRRVGGDIPSMGEHWIHPARVMSGILVARRPSVLIYTRVAGQPKLAGVAYTAVLRPGDPYPDSPAGADAWHEHNGGVDEGTLPLAHAAHAPSQEPTRVAVMHACIWVANPRGVWVADNWAMPFVRAGLRPDSAAWAAAHALALTADGGPAYYERAIALTVGTDEPLRTRAHIALTESAAAATAIRDAASGRLTVSDLARLDSIWNGLWAGLAASSTAAQAERLNRLTDSHR